MAVQLKTLPYWIDSEALPRQVPHQFAGTGYSGNGITFGTLAGMMACDGVLDRLDPWTDLFDVDRKNIAAGLRASSSGHKIAGNVK